MIHYRNRWALVTGASSALGRGLALRLADRGMSVVLTGRNESRLFAAAYEIRRACTDVAIETVTADLATPGGVSSLLEHVDGRPIEVLVNNAGFGSYGKFAEGDRSREADEIAVDVGAVITLTRELLPAMIARGSGGILNVASAFAFLPAPYRAVYGASKAWMLAFSEALWAEARPFGVSVSALCPVPMRGVLDTLGAVAPAAIYRRLADPAPVIEAGLRGLHQGRAVVIPGVAGKLLAFGGRVMPREWLARVSAVLLGPAQPALEIENEVVIQASPERVWELLNSVEDWPSWYRACRWVRPESRASAGEPTSFRWKAHPFALQSKVVSSERPRSFAFVADARGLHAEHEFMVSPMADGMNTVVVSHETQNGSLPWLARAFLGPRMRAANQAWLNDLARAASVNN